MIQKINESESWLLEKKNRTEKPLARFIKRQGGLKWIKSEIIENNQTHTKNNQTESKQIQKDCKKIIWTTICQQTGLPGWNG